MSYIPYSVMYGHDISPISYPLQAGIISDIPVVVAAAAAAAVVAVAAASTVICLPGRGSSGGGSGPSVYECAVAAARRAHG